MNSPVLVIIMAILFFVLTPGVLVSLPPGCDAYTTAAFHAILFSILWMAIKMPVYNLVYKGASLFDNKMQMDRRRMTTGRSDKKKKR